MYILISVLLILVLLVFVIFSKKDLQAKEQQDLPVISVLVAARNEEHTIESCLDALIKQSYPKEKLEIMVGDDDSEDNTADIIKKYAHQYSTVSYHLIKEGIGVAKGKANVLAQLASKAKGEYFLMTDADIEVPPLWCQNMLAIAKTNNYDIVTGVTTIKSKGWFSNFQKIDWLYSLALIKSVTDLGLGLTTMGNNMLISKAAYLATGGYEKIPFSVTEDFALFQAVIKNKGRYYQHFSRETLAYSQPIASLFHLFKQRKRWMKGAVLLPWYMVSLLLLQAFYYPTLCVALCFKPSLIVLCLALIKWLSQFTFIYYYAHRIGQKLKIGSVLGYEVYSALLTISLMIYYLMPTGVKWKGRTYS